ncbi:putative EF-hand domain-containing protein [Helianthus anomalus]
MLLQTPTVGSPELKATFDTIIEAFLFLDKNGDGTLNKKDVIKAMNEDFPMEKSPTHITKTRFSNFLDLYFNILMN